MKSHHRYGRGTNATRRIDMRKTALWGVMALSFLASCGVVLLDQGDMSSWSEVLTQPLGFMNLPVAQAAGRKYGTPKKPVRWSDGDETSETPESSSGRRRPKRKPSNLDLGMDIDFDELDELTEDEDTDKDQSPVDKAWKLTQEAMKLANDNQLLLALPKFQEAVDLGPEVAQFWNNLGVTEMRMGKLKAAYKHFNKALEVDPKDKAPISNLDDLLTFLKKPHGASMLVTDRSAEDIPPEVLHPESDDEGDEDEDFDLDELLPQRKKSSQPASQGTSSSAPPEDSADEYFENGRVFKLSGKAPPREGEQRQEKNQPPVKAKGGIQHTVRYLPRISVNDLYAPENLPFRTAQKPFILTNLTNLPGWKRSKHHKWSFEYFKNHEMRSAMVDFYPHNMESESVTPFMIPLEEAMNELQHPSGKYPRSKYRPGQYVQWNMNYKQWQSIREEVGSLPDQFTMDDYWFEGCLEDEKLISQYYIATHWNMILMGNKGAGMFNHWDILKTSSWQFQAQGSKKWHICPPSETHKMYEAGAVDGFNPDYQAYPLFKEADCYLDTVHEGEAIFYQKDYWHQTENLDDENFALTGTSVDWLNHESVANELVSECSGSTKRLQMLTPPLCKKLFNCYEWWRHGFAGEYKGYSPNAQTPSDLGRARGVGTFESLGVCPAAN